MVSCSKCKDKYFLYPNTYMFQVFDNPKSLVNSITTLESSIYEDYYSYQTLSKGLLYMNNTIKQCIKKEVPAIPNYYSYKLLFL